MASKVLLNSDAYYIAHNGKQFAVILERLHNDRNGNARRKAQIVFCPPIDWDFHYSPVRVCTFTSSGAGDEEDCKKALAIIEADNEKRRRAREEREG